MKYSVVEQLESHSGKQPQGAQSVWAAGCVPPGLADEEDFPREGHWSLALKGEWKDFPGGNDSVVQ